MHYLRNNDVNCMHYLLRILIHKKPSLLLILCYVNYVTLRVIRLSRFKIKLNSMHEDEFQRAILKYCKDRNFYADSNSCAFGNVAKSKEFASWFYLCSFVSPKRYKILIINLENIPNDSVYISDVMKFNIDNALMTDSKMSSYYAYSTVDNNLMFATEVIISQIANSYECPIDCIDSLLKNYFSRPRYLRSQDVFSVQMKEYCADCYYSTTLPSDTKIYFKVRDIKSQSLKESFHGFYVMREKTTLILEKAVQHYLPRTNFNFQHFNVNNWKLENIHYSECPPCLEDSLRHLKTSIFPFLQKDVRINVNPMFLIEGSEGSGKFKLVQIASKQLGLHLYDIDFREIQTLTSVQTEAKLRIAISNAEHCLPCILCFRNIQIFGINAEGKKDERIISAFETEIKKVFDANVNYPLIVIATCENTDLPVKLKRLFLEKISLNHPSQNQRSEILSYLLQIKGIGNKSDLQKIVGLCSDFVLADFQALILHGVKTKYNGNTLSQANEQSTILAEEDFNNAYEYMQSIISDRIGTPHVPKVYWKDIGGIGDLKHEIIKRIELPLLYNVEIGQSGLLLYGPPGTGKTLLAKAVATECQLHFFSIKGPELLNMYVGQSEKNVRQVFERARAAAPCIIFFDELDSLAPNRGQSGDSGGVMDRVVSQLLAEMDGLDSSNNIFIIGATNRPDLIDPALLRPGRFDKMLYVGIYSDKNSQISVLQALTRKFNLKDKGKELETLVDELPSNLTGADLYSVCSSAWLLAVRKSLTKISSSENKAMKSNNTKTLIHDKIVVELDDLMTAARDLTPSVSLSELKKYEKLRDKTK